MNAALKQKQRRLLGRVSSDTKGPPGFHMEASGLWNKLELSN
jgi:hypothetical protein